MMTAKWVHSDHKHTQSLPDLIGQSMGDDMTETSGRLDIPDKIGV